jgi:hypothetical protein
MTTYVVNIEVRIVIFRKKGNLFCHEMRTDEKKIFHAWRDANLERIPCQTITSEFF